MMGERSPFPLDGGRVGDGGDGSVAAPRPKSTREAISAPEWAPKKAHKAHATARARRLRQAMTSGERALWQALRKENLGIRRQAPIGPYVVDFACHAAKLVIEVDGYFHTVPGAPERDAERDRWLAGQGYRVVRFTDKEVAADLRSVVDRIVAETSPPSPTLPPSRGKGEHGV